MKPEIILIAAMDNNRAIGKNNDIPWRGKLPADMTHFINHTTGYTVVMGRKTWDSIPSKFRPLPARVNIVLTRDLSFTAEGALITHTPEEAIALTKTAELWICGGAEVYRQFLPHASRIELTVVDTETSGDTFFPELPSDEWSLTSGVRHEAEGRNLFPYRFDTCTRK